MVVRDEATLSALIHQHKGETGKLKVAWKWKPDAQVRACSAFLFCKFQSIDKSCLYARDGVMRLWMRYA
jgi:hypothetical protein